jgi:hypothetical protein
MQTVFWRRPAGRAPAPQPLHQRQPLRYMAPQVGQETLRRDDWSTSMSCVHR